MRCLVLPELLHVVLDLVHLPPADGDAARRVLLLAHDAVARRVAVPGAHVAGGAGAHVELALERVGGGARVAVPLAAQQRRREQLLRGGGHQVYDVAQAGDLEMLTETTLLIYPLDSSNKGNRNNNSKQ